MARKYFNTSELYGGLYPATMMDYRELAPRAIFREHGGEVQEFVRGVWETVGVEKMSFFIQFYVSDDIRSVMGRTNYYETEYGPLIVRATLTTDQHRRISEDKRVRLIQID